MKNSKKLVAFVMSMFMACSVTALVAGCDDNKKDNGTNIEQPEGPVKVKDGEGVSVKVGESKVITVSEYITANGETVTLSPVNSGAVTATLQDGKLTIVAKAQGTANVKLICGSVEVTFSVTVSAAEVAAAPEFDDVSKTFDVADGSTEVTLAPKTGGDSFNIEYSIGGELPDAGAKIEGDKLTFTTTQAGSVEITVIAKCTDKANAQNVKTVSFKVTIKASVYYTVIIDGDSQKVADGDKVKLPETTKQEIPDGKQFNGWQVGSEVKSGGSTVTVTGDLTITAVIGDIPLLDPVKVKDGEDISFRQSAGSTSFNVADYITTNKNPVSVSSSKEDIATVGESEGIVTVTAVAVGDTVITLTCKDITITFNVTVEAEYFTVSIEGVEQQVISGGTLKLPERPTQTIAPDKQFNGWQVGSEVVSGGSTITVTGNLTITAVIGDIPQADPEKIKDGEAVEFMLSEGSKTFEISDYLTTNGHAVSVVSSAESVATVSESGGIVTVTAVTAGKANITLTCKDIVLTFAVKVKNSAPSFANGEINIDKALSATGTYNIQPVGASTYSYNYSVDGATVEDGVLTYTATELGTQILTVSVTATDSATDEVVTATFTVTVNVTDTSEYRVSNGGFDNGLDGWTMTGDIGEISDNPTFWDPARPIENVGKYFRGEAKESNTGTLASSYFTVGGINKISFMLGAAGNEKCFVTLESEDGTPLAVWRNKQFNNPDCALTLVTYIADLSSFEGQTVRIVLNDNHNGAFGFFTFDELVTYYTSEGDLPQGFAAVNELADKSALNEKISQAGEIVQGDYTQDSFKALTDKIKSAREVANDKGATAQQIASAIEAIDAAVEGLTNRIPEEKDVNKIINLTSGAEITVDTADFVDSKELSSITYKLSTESENLTVDGMKITASDVAEDCNGTVTLTVKYKDATVLTVELTVKISSGDKPVVNQDEVKQSIDIYEQTDKSKIKLDFAENIGNPSNLTLTYSVKINDSNEELELDANHCYEFNLTNGSYSDEATDVIFTVTVGSEENTLTVEYTYTLSIKDTTAYRIKNGGFETGDLTDWTLSDPSLAEGVTVVQNTEGYWGGKAAYNHVGTYHFNGQEGGIPETATYTLTSSPFMLGGSGYISFRIGGRAAVVKIYNNATKTLIARYENTAYADTGFENNVPHVELGARQVVMSTYIADLSAFVGKELYLVLEDNMVGDWGHAIMDEVITYYEIVPEIEGKFDTVKNLCENDNSTTEIPWVKAVSTLPANSLYIIHNVEMVVLGAGTVDLNDHLYAKADTAAQVQKQIIKVSDGTAEYTENFNAFTLEEGKNYVVTYKLISGEYEVETTVKIVVGDRYSILNGGFEDDLNGWIYKVAEGSSDFGRIVSDDYYWRNTEKTFNKVGDKLFTGIETGEGTNQEAGMGTLTSSVFTLQKNGWISFLLGGAHNANCGIRVRSAADGNILAEFNNLGKGVDGTMDRYKYQFTDMQSDMQCYIEIFDNATGDWGLVVVDDIVTNCGEVEPEGTVITSVI